MCAPGFGVAALFLLVPTVALGCGSTSGPTSSRPPSPAPLTAVAGAPAGASAAPSQGAGGPAPAFADSDVARVPLPQGWEERQDISGENSVAIGPQGQEDELIQATVARTSLTTQQFLEIYLSQLQKSVDPAARQCGQAQQARVGGMNGVSIRLCFAARHADGRAVPLTDVAWAAASPDGSDLYLVEIRAPSDQLQRFATAAGPVVDGIQWKAAATREGEGDRQSAVGNRGRRLASP